MHKTKGGVPVPFWVWLGSVEEGLVYGLTALGMYITFRILSMPDLTVDGTFPLGAAVAATLITAGVSPWTATAAALVAGCAAGSSLDFYRRSCGSRAFSPAS